MKYLRVTKYVKEVTFEWFLDELGSKKRLYTQSFRKYMRLVLVCMRNSALREKFNFYFPRDF